MKTTIKEIFQAEGYSIPNYQRDYAWKDKNFKDLWEDLEEAIDYNKKGQGHFIGTMVVAKNEDNKKLYDICMTLLMASNERPPFSCSCMSWRMSKMRKTSKRQENIYTKRGN
ncbi:hypothetical protein HpHA170_00910 [Helicobacter pylori]